MKAVFVELPPFERFRADYFSSEEYRAFQNELMANPEKGDVIQGTRGLRKIRVADSKRGKGKRGGSRVIYYWAPFSFCSLFTAKTLKMICLQVKKDTFRHAS
ncbi:TPA: hypothetical protein ACLRIW_001587 [Neisseria meningitidis]